MYEEKSAENESWSFTSMVSTEDLQRKVSRLHVTIDQLRIDINDREQRICQLENDKHLLQKLDEKNKSKTQKLQRDIVLLNEKIKKQNSVEAVMTEKDKVIQELRDAVASHERKLDEFLQEEKSWTKKSEKMEKEIQLLKEKLQSHRSTTCCCKQSQVNVNQQSRGSHKKSPDKVLPLMNISEKLKDDVLYDQTYFDFRCHRAADDNKNEVMNYCENCNTKGRTARLSMCQHELCRQCIQVMSTRTSKRDPMSGKQSVTCSCLHCTMKVSLNEVENLLTTLSS